MGAKITFNIDAETIETLIDSAGYMIGYWAASAIEQDDGSWQYTVQEDIGSAFEGKTLTLDQAAVQRGLQVMRDKYEWHFHDILKGNDDAETGDVFVQCCIFGDIIFA